MGGTDDLTETAPVRRMAVARGTLRGASLPDESVQAIATDAAILAVKGADGVLVRSESLRPTHVDLLFADGDEGLDVTCTVQAFARGEVAEAALLGTAAALIAVGSGAADIASLAIVQSH